MKVTFTCEKCGYEHGYVNTDHAIIVDPERIWNRFVGTTCPHCTKLTYGPLTEEMVAEAIIIVADKWRGYHPAVPSPATQQSLAVAEARFVLRLLIDGGLANDKPTVTHGCSAEDWREWLLTMARQK